MIRLDLSKEIEALHLEYCTQKILPKIQESNNLIQKRYKDIHQEFVDYCYTEFKQLAIGKPKELRKFAEQLPFKVKELLKKNPSMHTRGEVATYRKFILDIFGYNEFSNLNQYVSDELLTQNNYNKIDSKLKQKWTPYTFILMGNIRVCPYCNRQYITPLYIHSNKKNKKHKLRADLDHFYPKSQYPYFSMSLYNLVPSCKFCNSSLKHTQEFEMQDVNPYEENFDDYFKFKVDILNDEKIYIEKTRKDTRIEHYLDYFQIKELYRYHQNQAHELVQKRLIYPDSYLEELYKGNEVYFNDVNEIKQLVVGYVGNKKEINNEVLAKFKRDIAEQLQFINTEQNEQLIEELKKLYCKV